MKYGKPFPTCNGQSTWIPTKHDGAEEANLGRGDEKAMKILGSLENPGD